VVGEFAFGHRPAQLTVPLGVTATLDADAGASRRRPADGNP
jgi:muramoyltetrapeptide carboxypeptidase LdcA involved in peptidoglycan recycling